MRLHKNSEFFISGNSSQIWLTVTLTTEILGESASNSAGKCNSCLIFKDVLLKGYSKLNGKLDAFSEREKIKN